MLSTSDASPSPTVREPEPPVAPPSPEFVALLQRTNVAFRGWLAHRLPQKQADQLATVVYQELQDGAERGGGRLADVTLEQLQRQARRSGRLRSARCRIDCGERVEDAVKRSAAKFVAAATTAPLVSPKQSTGRAAGFRHLAAAALGGVVACAVVLGLLAGPSSAPIARNPAGPEAQPLAAVQQPGIQRPAEPAPEPMPAAEPPLHADSPSLGPAEPPRLVASTQAIGGSSAAGPGLAADVSVEREPESEPVSVSELSRDAAAMDDEAKAAPAAPVLPATSVVAVKSAPADGGEKDPRAAVPESPIAIELEGSPDVVWKGGRPPVLQEQLLQLTEGEATFKSKVGALRIVAPAKIYLELPVRVTLQTGLLEATLRDSLQIDTPFGAAAADGKVFIRSSLEGMSCRVERGSAQLRSAAGREWLLAGNDFRMLTPTGETFDWHVSLDLQPSHRELTINGEPCKLSRRQFDKQVLARIVDALNAAQARVRQRRRSDLIGLLRINEKVRVYANVTQLPAAIQAAGSDIQAIRLAIKSGKARAKASDKQQLFAARKWLPKDLAALAEGRGLSPMRANPFVSAPRMQPLPPAALQMQLMKLPSIEVYRNNEEAVTMARPLARIANASPRSVPPAREPLFEMLPKRKDLHGLPFLKGAACQLPPNQRAATAVVSRLSRSVGSGFLAAAVCRLPTPEQMPGVVQVLQAKSHSERLALNEMLRRLDTPESLQRLAERAVFDISPQVRDLAVAALDGKQKQARPVFLEALRYPWAPVAMHAAEALVRLQDEEAVPRLIELLDAAPPSDPRLADGRWVTREVVKINHMQNCMLCHPPSTSSRDLMRSPVPMPDRSVFRTPVQKYYGSETGRASQAMVRGDITYLRQDFSVTTRTRAYRPWPDEQRFDFLVRLRPLTPTEQAAYRIRPAIQSYPQKAAVLFALRRLTGKNLEADSAVWRASLLAAH